MAAPNFYARIYAILGVLCNGRLKQGEFPMEPVAITYAEFPHIFEALQEEWEEQNGPSGFQFEDEENQEGEIVNYPTEYVVKDTVLDVVVDLENRLAALTPFERHDFCTTALRYTVDQQEVRRKEWALTIFDRFYPGMKKLAAVLAKVEIPLSEYSNPFNS